MVKEERQMHEHVPETQRYHSARHQSITHQEPQVPMGYPHPSHPSHLSTQEVAIGHQPNARFPPEHHPSDIDRRPTHQEGSPQGPPLNAQYHGRPVEHPDDILRGRGPMPGPSQEWAGETMPREVWDAKTHDVNSHQRVKSGQEFDPVPRSGPHQDAVEGYRGSQISSHSLAQTSHMDQNGLNRSNTETVKESRSARSSRSPSLEISAQSREIKKRGRKPKRQSGDSTGTIGPNASPNPSTAVVDAPKTPGENPEPAQPKKRGRKPKTPEDRETERKEAILRPWNVITPETHRRSIGHAEHRRESTTTPQPLDVKEKVATGTPKGEIHHPLQQQHSQHQLMHHHMLQSREGGPQNLVPHPHAPRQDPLEQYSPRYQHPGYDPRASVPVKESEPGLEAVVANALVDIQHENRFSPETGTNGVHML
ncbi:MAG: hypothetical protein BYD32DRAFT_230159 [Podila humilis]|nr:MAG: hypothetical protein BYD32DRAFT_230159 [Podila humilis]